MRTARKQDDDPRDLRQELVEMAALCVAGADNVTAASTHLIRSAKRDPALWAEMLKPYENQAARDLVGVAIRTERRAIWNRPTGPDQRVSALARANSSALLDFRLPGGMRLAVATRDDVAQASADYLSRAADMAWKGRWLARIADRIPEGRTVADELDEAALTALKAEVA